MLYKLQLLHNWKHVLYTSASVRRQWVMETARTETGNHHIVLWNWEIIGELKGDFKEKAVRMGGELHNPFLHSIAPSHICTHFLGKEVNMRWCWNAGMRTWYSHGIQNWLTCMYFFSQSKVTCSLSTAVNLQSQNFDQTSIGPTLACKLM